MTGDLVTTGTRFYDDVAEVIGACVARTASTCHSAITIRVTPTRSDASSTARGPRVLRNVGRPSAPWLFGARVAGIDDRMTGKDDLERTLEGQPEGCAHGADRRTTRVLRGGGAPWRGVVLPAHTHGGHIAVPFTARRASLSRLAQASDGRACRSQVRLPPLRQSWPGDDWARRPRRGARRRSRCSCCGARRRGRAPAFDARPGVPASTTERRCPAPGVVLASPRYLARPRVVGPAAERRCHRATEATVAARHAASP